MNVKFRDKNFVIATFFFFRDYLRAAALARTIHVVAPPTILTRGVGACKNRNNAEPFRILVLRQRLSIRLDALRRRDTYGRLLTFVIRLLHVVKERYRHTHVRTYVRASARYPPARASARSAAQHVAMPTINIPVRKIFVIRSQITNFTKILCHENLELYGHAGIGI